MKEKKIALGFDVAQMSALCVVSVDVITLKLKIGLDHKAILVS